MSPPVFFGCTRPFGRAARVTSSKSPRPDLAPSVSAHAGTSRSDLQQREARSLALVASKPRMRGNGSSKRSRTFAKTTLSITRYARHSFLPLSLANPMTEVSKDVFVETSWLIRNAFISFFFGGLGHA